MAGKGKKPLGGAITNAQLRRDADRRKNNQYLDIIRCKDIGSFVGAMLDFFYSSEDMVCQERGTSEDAKKMEEDFADLRRKADRLIRDIPPKKPKPVQTFLNYLLQATRSPAFENPLINPGKASYAKNKPRTSMTREQLQAAIDAIEELDEIVLARLSSESIESELEQAELDDLVEVIRSAQEGARRNDVSEIILTAEDWEAILEKANLPSEYLP